MADKNTGVAAAAAGAAEKVKEAIGKGVKYADSMRAILELFEEVQKNRTLQKATFNIFSEKDESILNLTITECEAEAPGMRKLIGPWLASEKWRSTALKNLVAIQPDDEKRRNIVKFYALLDDDAERDQFLSSIYGATFGQWLKEKNFPGFVKSIKSAAKNAIEHPDVQRALQDSTSRMEERIKKLEDKRKNRGKS